MASARYTHTHRFLFELLLSAEDYAVYAAQFGESLRQAVSNVKMGLVSKNRALAEGLEYLSSSFAISKITYSYFEFPQNRPNRILRGAIFAILD